MKKRILIAMSLVLVTILVVSACAQSSTTSTTSTTTTTSTKTSTTTSTSTSTSTKPATTSVTTSTPTTTTASKYGGTMRMSWGSQVGQFGYPPNTRGPAGVFANGVLETLMRRTNTFGKYDPCLATSWTLAPDKSSYTFQIRQGVKFHDGTELDAAAIKWNLDHIVALPGGILKEVKSIDVLDKYVVKINLNTWNVQIIDNLCDATCTIYSPTAFAQHDAAWADTHPIGTGPYIFKEWQQGQKYVYAKNPNFWDSKLPYFDGYEWIYIVNAATAKLALLGGEVDAVREVDVDTAKELTGSGKFAEEHNMAGHMILYGNSADNTSIWSNIKLRQALEYAVDKESITTGLGKGFDIPIYEIIFGAHALGDPGTTPRKYNLDKAKQLLTEAGYPNGGISVKLTTNSKFNTPYIVAVQSSLAKAGIKAEINPIPEVSWQPYIMQPGANNELRYDRQRGSDQLPLRMLNLELSDGTPYYAGTKRPDGWNNMMAALLSEPDPAKQIAKLEAMEKIAYDMAMFVPLFGVAEIEVFDPKLKTTTGGQIWFTAGGDPAGDMLRYGYFSK